MRRRRDLDNIVWPDQSGYYEKVDYPRSNDHSDTEPRPYTYGALGTSNSGSEPRAAGFSDNSHEEIALVPISHQQPPSPMLTGTTPSTPYSDNAYMNPGYAPNTYANMPTPSPGSVAAGSAAYASSSAYEHPQAAQTATSSSSQGVARNRSMSPPGQNTQTYLHPDSGLSAVPAQPGPSSASPPPVTSQQRKAAQARHEAGPREDSEAPPPAYTEGP